MLRIIFLLLILILIFTPSLAYAEGNCPPGFYPIGGQGATGCAPTGGNSSGSQASPSGQWDTRWGAFAIDREAGIVGTSVNKRTKSDARKDAKDACERQGGKKCDPYFFYKNQCAAIANNVAANKSMFSRAATLPEVEKNALETCRLQAGGAKCEILYSGCSNSQYRSY
ncbi:DUF4189 domain-containing protein [Xanthomonas campestris pv. zinniae]|uniref:DUF4189 domain-containing protein n=1 Tax=Xanthomonas cannabis TaxID=1885674 RepID=UPI001E51B5AE|nr:DUF4189 domain-containing protein [Xanthomonas campestris pv. zinniae]MCC4611899.1 DUF4189 domain-containing protein [Xanthomonas campestris pv. esculenti]